LIAIPALKTLGYFQSSLRDGEGEILVAMGTAARATTLSRALGLRRRYSIWGWPGRLRFGVKVDKLPGRSSPSGAEKRGVPRQERPVSFSVDFGRWIRPPGWRPPNGTRGHACRPQAKARYATARSQSQFRIAATLSGLPDLITSTQGRSSGNRTNPGLNDAIPLGLAKRAAGPVG
jgi:hypothetical protein